MADFLTDEWFAAVLGAAADLPEIPDLSFTFDLEVPESAIGKARGHGRVENGQLVDFAAGKYVSDPKGEAADVAFIAKAKRAMPVIAGDQPAMVAYMLGELKIDGRYELIIDELANAADRDAFEAFRAAVAAITG